MIDKIGDIDNDFSKFSNKTIIGVDDVGRGCIAGNMYIGFVSLNKLPEYPGIDDSKKLSKVFKNNDKRFILDKFIRDNSKNLVMQVSVDQINTGRNLNLLFEIQFMNGLNIFINKYNLLKKDVVVFLDGLDTYKSNGYTILNRAKFDSLSWNVAAASIIAKNIQVSAMQELNEEFPEYGFDSHNGYGTAKHQLAIKNNGICWAHRKNWIK